MRLIGCFAFVSTLRFVAWFRPLDFNNSPSLCERAFYRTKLCNRMSYGAGESILRHDDWAMRGASLFKVFCRFCLGIR